MAFDQDLGVAVPENGGVMRILTTAVMILAVVGWSAGRAQTLPEAQTLDSGVTVRVVLRSGAAVRGRLLGPFQPGMSSIRLCAGFGGPNPSQLPGCARELPVAGVLRVETLQRTRMVEGAIIGGVVGVGVGFLARALQQGLCERAGCVSSIPALVIPSTIIVGVIGAIIGSGLDVWGPAH